jgi:MerR family transcriptional regulator, thiopeptide resistance regulator
LVGKEGWLVYSVKQVSDLTGVSVRTLHYYDEIGLLAPSKVKDNGYRSYDDDALLRLQQILFYREVGLELTQIKAILDSPNFDLLAALREHREALQEKIDRLQNLVSTVDDTMSHLSGAIDMSKKKLFEAFSEEKQQHYTRVARLQYGPENVDTSVKLWNSYSKEKQQSVMAEAGEIYTAMVAAMESGKAPQSAEVQAILQRWHDNLRNFYEPTLEILRGLGEIYHTEPGFIATFQNFHEDLPEYLFEALHSMWTISKLPRSPECWRRTKQKR